MSTVTDRYIKALPDDQLRELHLELIAEIQKRQLAARSINEYNDQQAIDWEKNVWVELRD